MGRFSMGFLIVIVIAGLFVAYDGFFTLGEGKQAVITQFGRPVGGPIMQAGFHFKLPLIQKVYVFEKRVLEWDGDPNQIPTKDKKYIWVDTTARWRITDPLKFLQTVASEVGAQSRLDDIIDAVVRDHVSKNLLIELVRSSTWQPPVLEGLEEELLGEEALLEQEVHLGREEITRAILKDASKLVPQYGIELVDVRIKRINYVESVQEKVYTRMISERKRIAAQYRSEGEGRKAEILGQMERELKRIRSEAYRKAQEIQGRADAQATRIYGDAYGRDPEFYSFFKTLETYKDASNSNAYLILTTDSDYYKYLKKARP